MSIVSLRGMLVKRDFTSKLAIYKPSAGKLEISLANEKESFIVNSFVVIGEIMGTKYLPRPYPGVLHADKMDE